MSERTFDGIGVTPLSGVGSALWYAPESALDIPEGEPSGDVDADEELARFEEARERAVADLRENRDRVAAQVGEDEAAVFDAHAQFVTDPQIEEGVSAAIDAGETAEVAVRDTFDEQVEQFESMEGPMAERADDLRDVRDRLLRILLGVEATDLADLPDGTVVLAERLTPSDTAQLDPERVAGFGTVTGGRTSHAAIFARSLGIPAVVGVGESLRDVEEGTELLVDGTEGLLVANPTAERKEATDDELDVAVVADPVSTGDGKHVEVAANVGTAVEIEPAAARGADGIGLFRTEFLFLDRESPPDEAEQIETYTDALAAFPDQRVVFRTLDVGGDKPIPYLDVPDEENPFLGERGIRRSLGPDADLFETQLRALLRVAGSDAGGDVAVMLPLVATVEEVRETLDRLDAVAADLEAEGLAHGDPELGVMIETPAAVLKAAALAPHVDFFSIGTNDLTQYVMAAERGNERVEGLGDYRQPAVLRAIRETVEGASGRDCWVGMCGEMAGDPALTPLLLGLGLDELSMSALSVPAVKRAVEDTDTEAARALASAALEADTKAAVLDLLEDA